MFNFLNKNFHRLSVFFLCCCSFIFSHENKICVILETNNNQDTLYQCLMSFKNASKHIILFDNHSSDYTLEIIKEFSQKYSVSLHIVSKSDVNVSASSKELLEIFREIIKNWQLEPETTFLLSLKGDNRVFLPSDIFLQKLDKDAYSVLEHSDLFNCYQFKLNLLRASLPWEKSNSITKEWICSQEIQKSFLEDCRIDFIGDEKDKKKRQYYALESLKDEVRKNPSDEDLLLSLGLLHKTLKEYNAAIDCFQKKLLTETKKDQIWFLKYAIGECYQHLDEWKEALYWYLEAFQYKPDFPMPLKKIANYYRLHGKNDLTLLFAEHGHRMQDYLQNPLFLTEPFNSYDFDEEISIAAYYTHFKDEGLNAINRLILNKNLPEFLKYQNYNNLIYYIKHLPNAQFFSVAIDLPLVEESSETYNPMNPSICKSEDGYHLICRTVNYTQQGARIFDTKDKNGIFRTRNFLINYDCHFNKLSQKEIVDETPRIPFISSYVKGLEDCRIFQMDGNLWFTCSSNDNNAYGQWQICLCKLGEEDSEKVYIEKFVPLLGPDPYRCEKNWLPFLKDNSLHLIYSYEPFTVFNPNLTTGECSCSYQHADEYDYSSFRGSAGPVPFDNGYLILVHEVVFLPSFERNYVHRFVLINKEFKIQKLSYPFIFQHLGVEYCCSMTYDHDQNHLILPIGIEDREAQLCFIDIETVRSLLLPLP